MGKAGIAVPGTSAGALRTNCINTPGWFGSRPAMSPCGPKFSSDGPSRPRGHATSGKVWHAVQPWSITSVRPRAASASASVGLRSGGPSQAASRWTQASVSSHHGGAAVQVDSAAMRRHRALALPPALALTLVLALAAAAAGCTDRMAPSDDRFGRSGELIAMSGGEGGARYACITCHGARGQGNGYDAPRLAGLPAGYLQKQMEDYAAGLRPHALMRDVARFLDSHERVRVANHYAAVPPLGLPPATAERADASAAALYAKACESCHGADARGSARAPPLDGQPAFYLVQQLQDWQVSRRRNDAEDAMLKAAQQLGAEEIRQLSLHLAAIPARPAAAAR